MKELKLNSEAIISLKELDNVDNANLIPTNHKKLDEDFQKIIEYNQLLLEKKYSENEALKLLEDFKEKNTITPENKRQINKHISTYKTSTIRSIYINSKYQLIKEKELLLSDIYEEFSKNYLNDIIYNASNIQSIKIYDYYKNTEDLKLTIQNIYENINENINNNKRVNIIKKLINKKCNIQILTHLNTKESFDFYQKLYEYDNSISIKYIPESASENIYIPSLFFILIKYRIKDTNNYKSLVLYLEPSTNWGVVSDAYSVGFSSQFVKLLNIRFDEQFWNNHKLTFQPNKQFQTKDYFHNDVINILNRIDNELTETDTNINKEILNDIHTLKTNYKKIDYSYKLLKSFFYNISYLNIIKNNKNKKRLDNTNFVTKLLTEKKYINKMHNLLTKITKNHMEAQIIAYDVDISKLRRGVISEINGKIAICDIFSNMKNWTNKDDILNNLTYIATSESALKKLYEELNLYQKSFPEKRENFIKILIPKLIQGNYITLH